MREQQRSQASNSHLPWPGGIYEAHVYSSTKALLGVQDHLDAMAWSKMNVFHWHIVDDQSFPYESRQLPRLARFGAFSAQHTYSFEDVADIITYAKDRGIRVIPEIDTPGTVWQDVVGPCMAADGLHITCCCTHLLNA